MRTDRAHVALPPMTDSFKRDAFTLKRWSQRKLAAARTAQSPVAPASAATPASPPLAEATSAVAHAATSVSETPALPPVDSLTIDSDFTAFRKPEVDEALKRGALRKLFGDPHFNVMDGLDVYIDDYSKPDPLDPIVARQLMQARYIFDPPATQVNADGHVEDVPAETPAEPAADTAAAPTQSLAAPAASASDPPFPTSGADPLPVARDADPDAKPQ